MELDNTNQEVPAIEPSFPNNIPVIPTPKKPKNLFIIIAITVALIAIFGTGGYLLATRKMLPVSQTAQHIIQKPTVIPTSFLTAVSTLKPTESLTLMPTVNTVTPGWKIFNNLYGASFQYPPEWNWVSGDSVKANKSIQFDDSLYGEGNCKGDCPAFEITFLVSDNPQNLSVADFIKNDYANSGNPQYLPPLKIEDMTLSNGLQFKKATGIFNGLEYLYIQHNNKVYTISAFAGANGTSDDISNSKVQARLAVFNQVISTFQFTN